MKQPVFDDTDGPRSANPGKPVAEACRERENALNDRSDRIPMPLRLIVAALMGASRR